MALYNARIEEIRSALQVPQTADLAKAGEHGADQAKVLARYTGFANDLEKYAEWRDETIQESFAILKEESSSPSPDTYQSKWTEYYAKASAEASKKIMDALKDATTVAPELCVFAQTVSSQEAAFFAQCGRMTLARMSAQALLNSINFDVESDRLKDKWKSLGDSDRSVDEKVAATTKQIQDLFKETVEKVIAEQRGLAEKAANWKPEPGKVITDWKGALVEIAKAGVQAVMQALEPYKKGTATYVDALMQMNQQEETIVILFTQIREDVRNFVKKTNYESATKDYNEAVSNAESLAGGCPTSGGQKDAKLVARAAADAVKPFMDELKHGYEDFMNESKEIFTGPVGDKTVEELLELSENLHSWEDIERFNLPGRLDAALQDFNNTWTVNVDGLSGDDKEALRQVWKAELDTLAKGIIEAKEDRVRDQIPVYLKDKKKALLEKIKGSKGGGE